MYIDRWLPPIPTSFISTKNKENTTMTTPKTKPTPINKAGPEFNGMFFKFQFNGNKTMMKVIDNKTLATLFTTTIACHPDDKFSATAGVHECLQRYKEFWNQEQSKFKIGDKVRVINSGRTYPTYSQWLVDHNIDVDTACHFDYNKTPVNGSVGTIVAMDEMRVGENPHILVRFELSYDIDNYRVYLLDASGLERVN